MKTKYSVLGSTLLLCTTVLTVGCSSGGGSSSSDDGGGGGTVTAATTVVSGTTGAGSSAATTSSGAFSSQTAVTESTDTVAVLRVDKNGDGLLDENDLTYSIPVLSDGSFTFDNVAVDATKPTKAQLSVAKEGFAPVVKTVTLTKDTPLSIFADVSNTPVLTEVVELPATASDRANTFLKFGITSGENGLSSFSKLMTLSELQAEADVPLGEGTLTTASIPADAFDLKVKSVTVQMQAFDSTKADDIAHFPGEFSGHGKPVLGSSATGDDTEGALESAAFDLIKLTDQNGENIELQMTSDKLAGTAGADTCSGMYWVRRVTSSQAAVIEAWGDDDNNASNGFQVPIWSNDNATGTWAYVGEGDWDSSNSQFSACVDKKWEGYLNCDSQISIGTAPKELCIYVDDQFGNAVDGGLSFTAQKGNSYSSAYLYSGKAVLDLATGTPADWNVSYNGSWTSWSSVAVDSSTYAASTTQGCDFDLNVTVDNPYSAKVYVFVLDDQNVTVPNAYVSLASNGYSDYYSKTAYTNAKGYALFQVKPNVTYYANYRGGTSAVNVNGAIVSPETADSGKYASVNVQDVNIAPRVSLSMQSRVTDKTETLPFYISARDRNGDSLSLVSLASQGTTLVEGVDYNVTYTSSYAGNLYVRGIFDLNSTTLQGLSPSSLQQGNYTFTARVSDGKLSGQTSRTLNVAANSAPVIYSLYLVDSGYNYYYENSAIPTGDYSLNYYVYDRDGDTVTKTMTIDDVAYTPGSSVTLSAGDHNVTIAADDGALTSTKETHIYVGNHAPLISSAGATSYLIDINKNETFKLFAYVNDAENDALTVTALDDANVTHALTKVGSYGTKYVSAPITLTQAKAANNYTIVANDGEDNSTAAVVSVESIASNQPPVFTTALTDRQANVNEAQDFECVAEDPEGTFVTYAWKVNGKERSETGTTFSRTFTTTGSNTVSCIATDEDGESSTSTASVLVVDPNQSGTLTVHAKYQGLIVALHGADYNITQKTFTDANGDAAFNVTGDRTTFSITAWPGMEIGKKLTMDMIKPEIVYEARSNCEGNTSTECTNADWCALMSADSIPTWVWDAEIDESGSKPAAADIDKNPQDGSISQDELYAAAKAKFDAEGGNNDGKLTYQELLAGISGGENNSRSTVEDVYANVPVREYYLTLDQFNGDNYGGYQDAPYYYDECQEDVSFPSLLTVDYTSTLSTAASSSTNKDVSVSGSGYGSVYNQALDENNSVTVHMYTYSAGANGKFTYLVKERDNGAPEYHFYLLNDKTKAEMEANVTIAASDFGAADTNVSFVNSDNMSVYVNARYQKIYLDNSVYVDDGDNNNQTYTRKFFTHDGIEYGISTHGYDNDSGNNYSTYNYYGDGTLQSNYNVANYPALDVAFTVNPNDYTWTLTGNDMSKLNTVGSYFYANSSSDVNGTTIYNRFTISTYWTVAPSQSPQVTLEDIVPSEAYADVNESVNGENAYTDFGVDAEEFKGQTESSLLDLVAGSNSTPYAGETLYESGSREVNKNAYFEYSSSEATNAHRHSSMFKLRLIPSSK